MTVQIDTTAVNKKIRLQQQASHFAGDPETGYSWLYVVTGTAYGGLYLETDTGAIVGPFVTGTVGLGRILISEQTMLGTGTSTITFLNIPAIYKSLEIEYFARGTYAASAVNLLMYFNNDTTATNYKSQYLYGSSTTSSANAADSPVVSPITAASSTANYAGYGKITITGYANTAFNKGAFALTTMRDTLNIYTWIGSLDWESQVAINRIDIGLSNGSYDNGSNFRLYGVY